MVAAAVPTLDYFAAVAGIGPAQVRAAAPMRVQVAQTFPEAGQNLGV